MKLTVKEVSKLTGVSVRALHYYDQIGLFRPCSTAENGYRIYDDNSLSELQQILFFKELDFPLKEIKKIIENPSFDKLGTLQNHKELLIIKRNRIDKLINLVDNTMKGEDTMSFEEFDMTEIENAQKKYAKEAEERWGNTDAYKESAKKTRSYGKKEWAEISKRSDEIYKGLVAAMDKGPDSAEAQQLVKDWQDHITKYFYTCSNEILAGLGEMYVADERFTKNIDKYGAGLAKFKSDAIKIYCK